MVIDADDALHDSRLVGRPLILLGEPGSGKTEILRQWSDGRTATARQITHGWHATTERPFIDGLDEAAGLNDGDALDRLLGALKGQQRREFVIACRVADWRSAAGTATIKQWTGTTPVELKIEPLDHLEQLRFLEACLGPKRRAADEFISYYEDRSLGEWLGNPQTLLMLADFEKDGKRPNTTLELFEGFVERAHSEHRKQDTPLARANRDKVLDALGALFAAMILGSYDAISNAPATALSVGDLQISECATLPGISELTRQQLDAFLGSRLVRGAGRDRYTYQHRRIGEYLGARWLRSRVSTNGRRDRLLAALRHNGLVPSPLRGLWGWLAEDPQFAEHVVATDPMAVLEYANADSLSPRAATALLKAVERAADENPAFGWRDYHAAALVQPALFAEVERVLAQTNERAFWPQFILLRQMTAPEIVKRHSVTLTQVVEDDGREYAIRELAAEALADHAQTIDWASVIRRLAAGPSRDSLRLALTLMRNSQVGLVLSDAELAEALFAYSGLTPRFEASSEIGTVSLYYAGKTQIIPDERLDGMLDAIAERAGRYLSDGRTTKAWEIEHLFFALLRRRLETGTIDTDRVWHWLSPIRDDRFFDREERAWLSGWLRAKPNERLALQRIVLENSTAKPRSLRRRFYELSEGLLPSEDDLVALLNWLPEADARWRELFWFAPQREGGARVRTAAARHVRTDEDRQLIEENIDPPPLPVDQEHLDWMEQHERERQAQRNKIRADYAANRDRMRSGSWAALVWPANFYMGRTYEADLSLPAPERIGAWIGPDLQADALIGFEAFLTTAPGMPPDAAQIAKSHAADRQWNAALILSAALAERQRTGRGFSDLPTERIQAGLFAELVAFLGDEQWKSLRDALTDELARRGASDETARLFIEPQLQKRKSHVTWLWHVLASDEGPRLAATWLQSFPRMSAESEEELIDHLMSDAREESRLALEKVAKRRRKQKLDGRRRRNWQAIEFILGLKPADNLPATVADDPAFLWVLRDRGGVRRRNGSAISFSPALLASTVETFAPHWPRAEHPAGVSMGDKNAWNATDFLAGCLDSLAADPSPEATSAFGKLAEVDHGYRGKIRRSAADQRRARTNAEWHPIKVDSVVRLVTDGSPVDHKDLQQVVLSELDVVQDKIKSSREDVWRLFYADVSSLTPNVEDRCSDVLVTLLKQSDRGLIFEREKHLGDDRRADICCSSGVLDLMIECKRHWHKDLWSAFDWQLRKQQAVDWRARGFGVYIVYWFGVETHAVTPPPRGREISTPSSAAELESALSVLISERCSPSIAVKVLDLSRSRK